MLQNEEFIQEFVEEALEHIEAIETGLLKIEQSGVADNVVNSVFRSVHSVKGTAGFFGLKTIVNLAHAMENLFGAVRNNRITPNAAMVDTLLKASDLLKQMINDVSNSNSYNISTYLEDIAAFLDTDTSKPVKTGNKHAKSVNKVEDATVNGIEAEITDKTREVYNKALRNGHKLFRVELSLTKDLQQKDISPVSFFNKIMSIGNIVDSYTDLSAVDTLESATEADINYIFLFTTVLEKDLVSIALSLPEQRFTELQFNEDFDQIRDELMKLHSQQQPQQRLTKQEPQHKQSKQQLQQELQQQLQHELAAIPSTQKKPDETSFVREESIRVNVNLLNKLLNLASEIVLARNQLLRFTEGVRKDVPGLDAVLQNIDHLTSELQENIMQTRMQPISNVLNKFPRIARDLSRQLKKEVDLKLEGVEVELDKSIIEALTDPLTHLLRNALDHGIENPEVRKAKGKIAEGQVKISAYHEGGQVNIDIVDDGAGIDANKLIDNALKREVITESEVASLSEADALDLIFRPGFSTASQVSDVSGRGVGMDVVKTNIEKLGGTIDVSTSLGKGTTFRLTLPLTVAIISSLIVEVNGHRFALPQVNLKEMVRVKNGDASKRIEYINDSPVLRLRGRLLPLVNLARAINVSPNKNQNNLTDKNIVRILVLKSGGKQFGLVVDKIYDDEEILVKPLPKYIKKCRAYSGATILGDGKIALILDPEGLSQKAKLRFTDEKEESKQQRSKDSKQSFNEELQNLLLFHGPGPETLAISLGLVARVDEISASQIEVIGENEYIQYRGEALQVVRPENHLPITNAKNEEDKLYIIIPKLVSQPVGIIATKIRDSIKTTVKFDEDKIKAKGLLGSGIVQDSIVLFVNVYDLLDMALPQDQTKPNSQNNIHKGKTVLLAEDSPFFTKVEKQYLEDAGFNVLHAADGKEALEVLGKQHIDILISDIEMPYINGIELIKTIRSRQEYKQLPAIAVTSLTGEQQKSIGIEAGYDYYEFKLDKAGLINKIYTLLERKRAV